MSYILVDIDGVVADCGHRVKLIPDWDAFFAAAKDDKPIQPIIDFLREIDHLDVVFITGRPERIRALTIEWFSKYKLYHDELLMRADGDYREDYVVKRELYEAYRKEMEEEEPIAIFEDRDQVVGMWRELGLLCFQPKKGDY